MSVLGAICLSTLLTFLVCFLTRFTHTIATFEPLIFILTGIICYALSDCLLFSGVIAVIICALILVRYAEFNVDRSSLKSFETCIHMISHSFEGLLFFDMGIQFTLIFIKNIHEIDWFYCLIAIPITFVARFVAILLQTAFINVSRNKVGKPIKMTDQIILLFCGLRGGISFALVRAWNMGTIFKKEDQEVLATSFLIVFTVYCYGCLMRPLIIGLGIETEEERRPEEMIGCTTLGYSASTVQNFVQTLLGQNSSNAFKRFLGNLDHQLQNILLRTPLIMDRELLEQAEQVKQLQQQLIISRFQQQKEWEDKVWKARHRMSFRMSFASNVPNSHLDQSYYDYQASRRLTFEHPRGSPGKRPGEISVTRYVDYQNDNLESVSLLDDRDIDHEHGHKRPRDSLDYALFK